MRDLHAKIGELIVERDFLSRGSGRLGESTGLHRNLDEPGQLEKRLADVFWHIHKGQRIREGLVEFEQRFKDTRGDNVGHYTTLRRNVGLRVRDYQSHSSAALMAQDCLE